MLQDLKGLAVWEELGGGDIWWRTALWSAATRGWTELEHASDDLTWYEYTYIQMLLYGLNGKALKHSKREDRDFDQDISYSGVQLRPSKLSFSEFRLHLRFDKSTITTRIELW